MKQTTYATGVKYLLGNETGLLTKMEAVKEALNKGFDFIIQYYNGRKTILSWNCSVEAKKDLEDRYVCDGDKRSILASSNDKYWLVLKTSGEEIILPLSKVEGFQKVELFL